MEERIRKNGYEPPVLKILLLCESVVRTSPDDPFVEDGYNIVFEG